VKNSEDRLFFDGFALDLQLRTLLRGSQRVKLTPKPFDVLACLVAHRGEVVGKDALHAEVWRGIAVTDDVLVQAVHEIRRALDDDKDSPRFIQTVPREGYRFIAVVTGEPAEAVRSNAPPPRAGWRAELLALVIVGAGALIVWRLPSFGTDQGEGRDSSTPEVTARVVPVTSASISAVKPVFSPDGKTMLYLSDAAEAPGSMDLFVMPFDAASPLRLTHRANAAGDLPVYTADGRGVVFSRYRMGVDGSRVPDLWKVSAFGGTPLRYIADASDAGFSPDGARVAFTRHAASGRVLVVSPVDRVDQIQQVGGPGFTPRWSPDGRWLAFTTSYPEGGEGQLWIVSSSLADRRVLTTEPQQMYGLAWSADSRSIIFAARIANAFHLRRVWLADGSITTIASGVGSYLTPTVSPDGRLVAFSYLRPVRDLAFASPIDAAVVRTLTENELHRWPRFSPSGRLIASVVQRSTDDDYLFVSKVETGESRRVSQQPAQYPCWIDEDHIAYVTTSGASATDIRRVDLTTGEDIVIAHVEGLVSWLAERPGTSEAAFVVTTVDRRRIVLRDFSTGRESTLAEGLDFWELRWRPDGEVLAWSGPPVAGSVESNGIWNVRPGTSAPQRVVTDGFGPAWGAEGYLFFLRYLGDHDDAGIWQIDIANGREHQVRRIPRVDYFDVSGQSLVFARNTGRTQIFTMPLQ
jgi:DNA-binding winged helix-turn-helix (wHTH) protein/Tol biopolymer transport system component